MTDNTNKQQYHGDTPLTSPEDDAFSRYPFSARIAETVALRTDESGIVVGIYGAWGEGKTSAINFIRHRLADFPNVLAITFNPWRFPNEDQLIFSFFKTIAASLDQNLQTDGERLGESLTDYAKLIAPVFRGASDAAEAVGKVLSSTSIEEYKKRIDQSIRESGKRIVVVMDDIDRLDKTEIHAVFRLVKLSADFAFTSYILAFDNKMVSAVLNERYPSSSGKAGANFLEKIIQVPLGLPPAPKSELETMCFQGIDDALQALNHETSDQEVNDFHAGFSEGIAPALTTPRNEKRYINALTFSLPLVAGEVYFPDFLLTEAIRVFYPKL